MTRLFASTALIALLAAPAIAQTATDAPTTEGTTATTAAPAADGAMTTTAAPTTDGTMATTAPADTAVVSTAPANTTAAQGGFGYDAMDGDMSAETFIGKRLYVSETDVDPAMPMNEADENWDDVGEIGDLVLSRDGQLKAVLADIGGFLGLGERTVAVSMDQLRMVRDGDAQGEYFIVFTADRAGLENAPEFEWPAE